MLEERAVKVSIGGCTRNIPAFGPALPQAQSPREGALLGPRYRHVTRPK